MISGVQWGFVYEICQCYHVQKPENTKNSGFTEKGYTVKHLNNGHQETKKNVLLIEVSA